jgi:prevent-host-death family protein
MKVVGSFEAKTHLSALLDEVARGESITISKHGRPVAMLVPADANVSTSGGDLVKRFENFRAKQPKVDVSEWKAWVEEGRR